MRSWTSRLFADALTTILAPPPTRLLKDEVRKDMVLAPESWIIRYRFPVLIMVSGTRRAVQDLANPEGSMTALDITRRNTELVRKANSQAEGREMPRTGGVVPRANSARAVAAKNIQDPVRTVSMSLTRAIFALFLASRKKRV